MPFSRFKNKYRAVSDILWYGRTRIDDESNLRKYEITDRRARWHTTARILRACSWKLCLSAVSGDSAKPGRKMEKEGDRRSHKSLLHRAYQYAYTDAINIPRRHLPDRDGAVSARKTAKSPGSHRRSVMAALCRNIAL